MLTHKRIAGTGVVEVTVDGKITREELREVASACEEVIGSVEALAWLGAGETEEAAL